MYQREEASADAQEIRYRAHCALMVAGGTAGGFAVAGTSTAASVPLKIKISNVPPGLTLGGYLKAIQKQIPNVANASPSQIIAVLQKSAMALPPQATGGRTGRLGVLSLEDHHICSLERGVKRRCRTRPRVD